MKEQEEQEERGQAEPDKHHVKGRSRDIYGAWGGGRSRLGYFPRPGAMNRAATPSSRSVSLTPMARGQAPPLHVVFFGDDTNGTGLSWLQGLWPVLLALLCWLVVPVIASYVISQGPTRLFSSRYLVTIVPPLFLLVGMGIATLRWRLIQVALVGVLLFVALHHVPQYYDGAQVEDWRTPALWLEQHYQAGDGMVCYNNAQGCELGIEYYLRAYPSGVQFPADSPGAFPWVDYDLTNHLGYFGAAVKPTFLAAYGAKHPRLFFIAGRFTTHAEAVRAQAAQHWLDTHYHLIAQSTQGTVTIRLYATNVGS